MSQEATFDVPVVLLHGLARTRLSMAGMGRFLQSRGHQVWARTYPSRRRRVEDLAELLCGWIRADFGDQPVSLVTHSLGGIVARAMPSDFPLHRVVMLAPPNRGSSLARRLANLHLYQQLYGPAGQQVAMPYAGVEAWTRPDVPLAVIAGTGDMSLTNPVSWLSRGLGIFDSDSDGTVATPETQIDGMWAYAEVDANHSWIMNHPSARHYVAEWLERGHITVTDEAPAQTESNDPRAAT